MISKLIIVFLLTIDFTLANSANPIEMPRYVAFHLGLSCLQKYLLGPSSLKAVKSL